MLISDPISLPEVYKKNVDSSHIFTAIIILYSITTQRTIRSTIKTDISIANHLLARFKYYVVVKK